MRFGWLTLVLLLSCKQSTSPVDMSMASDGCALLFGNPNEATGLSGEQCRASCSCGGTTFQPPSYDAAFIQSLIDDDAIAARADAIGIGLREFAARRNALMNCEAVCMSLLKGNSA